jgi:hypothetical protein
MKLFERGNIEQWGIRDQAFLSQNREQLMSSFEFAAPHMLPGETEDAIRLEKVFLFMTNQV